MLPNKPQYHVFFQRAARDILGSDGYLPLDQRLTRNNMITAAKHAATRLKGIKHITGIRLAFGTIRDERTVSIVPFDNRAGE